MSVNTTVPKHHTPWWMIALLCTTLGLAGCVENEDALDRSDAPAQEENPTPQPPANDPPQQPPAEEPPAEEPPMEEPPDGRATDGRAAHGRTSDGG